MRYQEKSQAKYLNEARLIGDIYSCPTFSTTHSGTDVVNFQLRTQKEFRRYDGTLKTEDTVHSITIFGVLTNKVRQQELIKGTFVELVGRINFVVNSNRIEIIVSYIERL